MSLKERMDDLVPGASHATTPEERIAAGLRPTGQQIFDSKTPAEQDEMLGPEAAEKVRAGEIELADLVARSHLDEAPDFITQRPVQAL